MVVRLAGDRAVVDGAFVFDTNRRRYGHLNVVLPLVVRTTDELEKIAAVFEVQASGNLFGIERSPQFREAYEFEKELPVGLPSDLRLVFASWEVVGATASNSRTELAISYRQPLYHGVFYYLPLTKARWADPEDVRTPPNPALQARLIAEDARQVSLEMPVNGAIWSGSSVALNLRHRNLIAATQVSRPTKIDRLAPYVEVIAGQRRCALHQVALEETTIRVPAQWQSIMTVDLEPFKDCPNAFRWLASPDGSTKMAKAVDVRFESCPKCEEGYSRRSAQKEENEKRKSPTIAAAFEASSAIFYGRVASVRVETRKGADGSGREVLVGSFKVLRTFKGNLGATVEVETPADEIDGRYSFSADSYHLIYATGQEPYLTDDFSRSVPGWMAESEVNGKVEFRELEKLAGLPPVPIAQ